MGNRKKKDKKKALKHRFATNEPETGAPSGGPVIHFARSGEVKMSEVLMDLLAPYDDTWETIDELHKLVGVGVVAWNATVAPPDKGEELVQSMVETLPLEVQADFLQLVVSLMERKVRFFADNTRLILSYELTELPDGEPHLSVVSTLNI